MTLVWPLAYGALNNKVGLVIMENDLSTNGEKKFAKLYTYIVILPKKYIARELEHLIVRQNIQI